MEILIPCRRSVIPSHIVSRAKQLKATCKYVNAELYQAIIRLFVRLIRIFRSNVSGGQLCRFSVSKARKTHDSGRRKTQLVRGATEKSSKALSCPPKESLKAQSKDAHKRPPVLLIVDQSELRRARAEVAQDTYGPEVL